MINGFYTLHSRLNQIFNNRILAALFAYGKFYGNLFFALVTVLLYAGNLISNSYLPSLWLKFSIQSLNHIHEYYQFSIRKTKGVLLSITNANFS